MTTRTYTNYEIATDFTLWGEYVDPEGTMTKEQFEAMTVEEKIKMIEEIFES